MKFLALLFFVGLTLTSARRIPSQNVEYSVDSYDELDLFDQFQAQNEEQSTGSEVAESLREILDRLLERFINLINEKPDTVSDGLETFVERIRELRQLLREREEDLGTRARQILERIREKLVEVRDSLRRRLREIFEEDSGSAYDKVPEEEDTASEVAQRLREILDRVLDRITRYLEDRKVSDEDSLETLVERIREIGQIVKQRREELGARGRQILERIRDRIQKLRQILGRKLREIFGIDSGSSGAYAENIQTEGKNESLKEKFEKIVQRIKDEKQNGTNVEEALEQLREIINQKLREKNSECRRKNLEVLKRLQKNLKERIERIFEEKRNITIGIYLRKLRGMDVDEIDIDELETKVEEYFGKRSEISQRILNVLREKDGNVRQRVLAVIDTLLDETEGKRSLNDTYENIRDFFEHLAIRMRERYLKFGEWARQKYDEGLERGRDKVERIRKLAREYINDLKIIGKDVREQGFEFFREYKEDLKNIWEDIQNKIQEIRSRE